MAKDTRSLAGSTASLFQIKNVHFWYFIKEKLMLKEEIHNLPTRTEPLVCVIVLLGAVGS